LSSGPVKNESSRKMILVTSWLTAAGRDCSTQNKSSRASRRQEPKSKSCRNSAREVCSCPRTADRELKASPQAGGCAEELKSCTAHRSKSHRGATQRTKAEMIRRWLRNMRPKGNTLPGREPPAHRSRRRPPQIRWQQTKSSKQNRLEQSRNREELRSVAAATETRGVNLRWD
jgi:hypothetical protein